MHDALAPFQDISRDSVPLFDFHLHTTWTDGSCSAVEMHQAAIASGLACILFSEHARKSSGDWYGRFADEIRALPQEGCRALVGVETKITDFSGDIDLSREIVSQADLVMASVHRFPGEEGIVQGARSWTPEQAIDIEHRLALGALSNPDVDILGHPFGMCYRRFKLVPPDELMRDLISVAARTGVAIEINSHYHPDPWKIVDWCRAAGARLSLGSNAHDAASVGRIQRILNGKEKAWIPSAS